MYAINGNWGVNIWNLADGKLVKIIKSFDIYVSDIKVSNDQSKIYLASDNFKIRIIDTLSGLEIKEIEHHGAEVSSIDLNETRGKLLSGCLDSKVRIFELDGNL